ncbi:hypothetical protein ABQE93_22700 [Mycolicibacterium sp. XJ662]
MALAILRLDDSDDTGVTFIADTGTSSYYRINLGKEVRREDGLDLIDGPYWSSPLQRNPKAGRHVDTRTTVRLPADAIDERGTLAQLETCRQPDGRGPAYSRPVRVPAVVRGATSARRRERALSMSAPTPVGPIPVRRPARTVPVYTAKSRFSRTATVADLIGAVSQAAAPVLLEPTTKGSGGLAVPALLAEILRIVLGALAPSPPPSATPALARAASARQRPANRFVADAYTRPMIFGIDDALLAAVAGPLVQALPQLLNAANKAKQDDQAKTDKQVTDLLSEVNRTMLMQQLISAQNQPVNPGVTSSDLAAIGSLLQQLTNIPAPVGTPATAVSRPASTVDAAAAPIASRAVLATVTAPAVTVLGGPRVAFLHDQSTILRYRLDAGSGGPAGALRRAILTVCLREPGGSTDLCRRSEKLTDLVPGTEIKVALTTEERDALPEDTDLEVVACLRWKGAKGTYQATCAHRIMLTSRVSVRDRGEIVGGPVELTDMNRFRLFWNKVWESATRGASTGSLPLWGLDAALRYSVVTVSGAHGNGLMQTRIRQQPTDEGLRDQTTGRIKSGIEVSVAELNKLLPLWPGRQPVSDADLAAFNAPGWLAGHGGDAVTEVRMQGKRGTRGVLWVVPVLRLRAFTLAAATDVDPYGQLVATQDRVVHFPVIESIRVIGLGSLREGADPGEPARIDGTQDASGAPATYQFDGYDVVLQSLVGLEPALPIPRANG